MWFIDDTARSGAINMAIDDILNQESVKQIPSVVFRLYRWNRPTLSCGYHQKLEKRVDFGGCRLFDVEVVRRPTGGRELLHDGDLSFSFTARASNSSKPLPDAREFFFAAGRVIAGGLKALGVSAAIETGSKRHKGAELDPCLTATSQYEIVASGKKLVPMAQRLYSRSILVHGSIAVRDSRIPTARLLKTANADRLQKSIDTTATSLERLLDREVDIKRLKQELLTKYEEVFKGRAECLALPEAISTAALQSINKWEIDKMNSITSGLGR